MKAVLSALLAILAIVLLCLSPSTEAKTLSIYSTNTQAQIDAAVALLLPGDVLQVNAGVYVGISLNLANIAGTIDAWITIEGVACGSVLPWIQANTSLGVNGITINAGVSFVAILGLKISHVGLGLQAGIYIDANVNNIYINNCVLDTINGIGIDLLGRNNIANIVISSCVLSNIGVLTSISANLGIGIAVGGLSADVGGVVNITLLNNLIHDVTGFEGAAIKVLLGVYAAVVQNNVVYNCPLGSAPSTYTKAAITVAVGANVLASINALAVVSGNIVVGSASTGVAAGANVALAVGAGVQVFNNLLLGVNVGIDLTLGSAVSLSKTLIAHNTVHSATLACLRAVANGLEDATLRIVNNLFSVGADASVYSIFWVNGNLLNSAVFAKQNFVTGVVSGTGSLLGQILSTVLGLVLGVVRLAVSLVSALVNPILTIPGADFMCQGPLIGAGVSLDLSLGLDLGRALSLGLNLDLDLNVRLGLPDIGCYQHVSNGDFHWPINLCKWNQTCNLSPLPCPSLPTVPSLPPIVLPSLVPSVPPFSAHRSFSAAHRAPFAGP
eukprot:TRINITY_DN7068_c0_g1_i1.p1 TRINITY_DN7068_c0_g1~~TRINITY_DN7068_c0_g1_i1.p1  ORF type:complete len:555 (+),score=90.92 TRINITY_DN7068_c0_g1_i1:46-1710(+)